MLFIIACFVIFNVKNINRIKNELTRTDSHKYTNFPFPPKNRLKSIIINEGETKYFDENRFEQELIYYLEKQDITEEKVRLQSHLQYFSETLKKASNGKKLGFITQEIGREINTIGSKASDKEMQKIVVEMKDELEKIKEQLLNIL